MCFVTGNRNSSSDEEFDFDDDDDGNNLDALRKEHFKEQKEFDDLNDLMEKELDDVKAEGDKTMGDETAHMKRNRDRDDDGGGGGNNSGGRSVMSSLRSAVTSMRKYD